MPRRESYPIRKEMIGLRVSPELRQRIRDHGASLRDADGPVSESFAARDLIMIGLQSLEPKKNPKKSPKKA